MVVFARKCVFRFSFSVLLTCCPVCIHCCCPVCIHCCCIDAFIVWIMSLSHTTFHMVPTPCALSLFNFTLSILPHPSPLTLLPSLLPPVHPNALPDYEGLDTRSPNAVVLADAASAFTYDSLNLAFKVLMNRPGTKLISLGIG